MISNCSPVDAQCEIVPDQNIVFAVSQNHHTRLVDRRAKLACVTVTTEARAFAAGPSP
jgi:hypothetical protein